MFRKRQKLRRLTQKLIDKGLDPKSEGGLRFLRFLSERNYGDRSTVIAISGEGCNIVRGKFRIRVYDHDKGMTLWLILGLNETIIVETYDYDSSRIVLAGIPHV